MASEMWAVVDHQQRAVWGVGESREAALANAREEARAKTPGNAPSELEFAQLSPDADLEDSGEALYQHILTEPSPAQGMLL